MSSPVLAFQAAIATALDAAEPVTELLGAPGRIFDETPAGQRPPYAYFGAVNRQRREDGFGRAWTIRARMYVVTDEFGRAGAWAIADAITAALDDVEIAIAEPFVAADVVRVIQAGDVVEPGSDKMVFVDLQATIERH